MIEPIKIAQFLGNDVFVRGDGKFYTRIHGVTVTAASMSGLKAEVAKRFAPKRKVRVCTVSIGSTDSPGTVRVNSFDVLGFKVRTPRGEDSYLELDTSDGNRPLTTRVLRPNKETLARIEELRREWYVMAQDYRDKIRNLADSLGEYSVEEIFEDLSTPEDE